MLEKIRRLFDNIFLGKKIPPQIESIKEEEELLTKALMEKDPDRRKNYLIEAAEKGNQVAVSTLAKMGHPTEEMPMDYQYSIDSDVRFYDRLSREVSNIQIKDKDKEENRSPFVSFDDNSREVSSASHDEEDDEEEYRELTKGFEMYKKWLDTRQESTREWSIYFFEHHLSTRHPLHDFSQRELEATVILADYYKHRDSAKYREFCEVGANEHHPLLSYAYGVILKREGKLEESLKCFQNAMAGGDTAIPARFQFVTICMQSGDLFFRYQDDLIRYIEEGIEAAEMMLSAADNDTRDRDARAKNIKDEYYGFFILRGQYYLKIREKVPNRATYNDYTDLALQSFEYAYKMICGRGPVQLALIAAQELHKLYRLKGNTDMTDFYERECMYLRQMSCP